MANEADQVVAAINNYGAAVKTELDITDSAKNLVIGKKDETVFINNSNQPGSVLSTEMVKFFATVEDDTELADAQALAPTITTIIHTQTQMVWTYNATTTTWEEKGAITAFPEEYPRARFYYSEWNNKCFYFSQSVVFRRTA